jgi:hypothetical protein
VKWFEKFKAGAGMAIFTLSIGGTAFYFADKPFENIEQIICTLPGLLIGLKWG